MSETWYVASDGQQLGPYTGEQLLEFAQSGNISAQTLVWAEGMTEWLPASQIPGLFPAATTPAPALATTPPLSRTPAWAPPGARTSSGKSPQVVPTGFLAAAPIGGSYPYLPIRSASFGLWMWIFLGSLLCSILAIVCLISAAHLGDSAGMDEGLKEAAKTRAVMGWVIASLGSIFAILSGVFLYMNLYRAWSCLQAGAPRTTPGKAVGFLFIPFFNLYWLFVAIAGLPKDWNRIVSSYEDLQDAPRLNEKMFLLLVIPPMSLVLIFPVMSQLCKGINYFAFRHNPSRGGAFAKPGPGGFKFS